MVYDTDNCRACDGRLGAPCDDCGTPHAGVLIGLCPEHYKAVMDDENVQRAITLAIKRQRKGILLEKMKDLQADIEEVETEIKTLSYTT